MIKIKHLLVVFALVAVIFIFLKFSKGSKSKGVPTTVADDAMSSKLAEIIKKAQLIAKKAKPKSKNDFPLSIGSEGDNVLRLTSALNIPSKKVLDKDVMEAFEKSISIFKNDNIVSEQAVITLEEFSPEKELSKNFIQGDVVEADGAVMTDSKDFKDSENIGAITEIGSTRALVKGADGSIIKVRYSEIKKAK